MALSTDRLLPRHPAGWPGPREEADREPLVVVLEDTRGCQGFSGICECLNVASMRIPAAAMS